MTGPRASRSRSPNVVWGMLSAMAVLLNAGAVPRRSPYTIHWSAEARCPHHDDVCVTWRAGTMAEAGFWGYRRGDGGMGGGNHVLVLPGGVIPRPGRPLGPRGPPLRADRNGHRRPPPA